MKKITKFLKDLWKVLRLPEMLILPGNLAFFLILSLVPIITLFSVIASGLSLSTSSIVSFVGNVIPNQIMEILVTSSDFKISNIILILIGFFLASNGPDSLITASNILYRNNNKNYIYRRIKALFMTFWLLLLFIFALLFLAFGSFILTKLLAFGVLGDFIKNHYIIITIVKYLIGFIMLFMTIKILYTMAPDVKIKSKYVNKGTIFSTIMIILVTSFYSFYVNNIANYNVLYGSLSNIAILMLLVYIISYIIVLGIAINHNYYESDVNKN